MTAEEDWQRLADTVADLRRTVRAELDRLLLPLLDRLVRWLS
jgi:hypothetical protein